MILYALTICRMKLAQINIARMRAPLESDEMFEFREFLAPINVLAEAQSGFVWRLKDDAGASATEVEHPFEDDMVIVNMSVWDDYPSLRHFVFDTAHSYFVRSRRKWFERMRAPYVALWWVPDEHEPTLIEAKERLDSIGEVGPGPRAFVMGGPYDSAGVALGVSGR